jgi:hypothetical protein
LRIAEWGWPQKGSKGPKGEAALAHFANSCGKCSVRIDDGGIEQKRTKATKGGVFFVAFVCFCPVLFTRLRRAGASTGGNGGRRDASARHPCFSSVYGISFAEYQYSTNSIDFIMNRCFRGFFAQYPPFSGSSAQVPFFEQLTIRNPSFQSRSIKVNQG